MAIIKNRPISTTLIPARPSKVNYYLDIAKSVSARSTCLRRRYGAIIVKNDEIIATGYNGAPRGEENCCTIGECYRKENDIPHGTQYELCRSVHAEQNAIISAARKDMIGSDLYLYGEEDGKEIYVWPCTICTRLIKNAGICWVITKDRVVYRENVNAKWVENGNLAAF